MIDMGGTNHHQCTDESEGNYDQMINSYYMDMDVPVKRMTLLDEVMGSQGTGHARYDSNSFLIGENLSP